MQSGRSSISGGVSRFEAVRRFVLLLMNGTHEIQRRGVPARLVIFPDETHFVTRPANS
jgi:hypothetical protein